MQITVVYKRQDDAYLLSAREFGGSDTYATATIIATALKKIGFDLVVTGRQAIDGDTAQVLYLIHI